MDFVSRTSDDLSWTKSLYGEKSNQYSLHKKLLDAEEAVKAEGHVALGKECENEYILQVFYINPGNSNSINLKNKFYLTKDASCLKNVKSRKIKGVRTIHDVVSNDVYDLIVNHQYQVVDFNQFAQIVKEVKTWI